MAMSKGNFPVIPELNLDEKGNENYDRVNISVKCASQSKYDAHLNDDEIYQIRHHPKGRVLIINNGFRDSEKYKPRIGSKVDVQSLDTLWTQLECTVIKSQHLTSFEIKEEIAEFTKMQKPVDFCAVFIMTNGKVRDMVIGEDGTTIDVKELVDMFKPDKCPHLKEIPKLMFFQMCRGLDKRTIKKRVPTQILEDDGNVGKIGYIIDIPDMLLGFATLEGEVSIRDTERGSWFIQAIVDVFSRNAHVDDIVKMMENVQEQVVRKRTIEGVTITSITATTLKKKLFFYPGCKISSVIKSGTQ